MLKELRPAVVMIVATTAVTGLLPEEGNIAVQAGYPPDGRTFLEFRNAELLISMSRDAV
ncbi:hypothetical protein EV131_1245 [Rhizobium laguerreae]|uniref:Uncharacterized protein n=1 Tax=Rhizobium laguerreae TaxID=1076926 RepID=A0AAX2QB79_9HYPH|nr:hypothetical protein EV131_1245 [Rhizobium laguerreae]